MEMGGEIELPEESMAYLMALPEPDALGHITMTSYHPDDNSMGEFGMKKSVFQYLLYYVGVGLCGAAQAGAFN